MQYHVAGHAADRLVERTASTGVFDPRTRAFVDASSLDRGDLYGLCKSQLYRSHMLPARWQMMLAPMLYASFGQLPEGQVIVRFDDYFWVLKLIEPMKYKAVTMLAATPEQMDVLGIEPHELYVTIAGAIMASMRSQMLAHELPAVMTALEDTVRRAVHFGTPISWEQAREAVGSRMTHGSARWSWYAGPVAESWDREHLLDRPLTMITGMRFMNGLSQTDAAYVLDRPYVALDWLSGDVAEQTVDEVAPVRVPPEETTAVPNRDLIFLPVRKDGQTGLRTKHLLALLKDVPHAGYVIRQMRRLQPTPLSFWGVYNIFGYTNEPRTAGCLFRFGSDLPLDGYGIALGYKRRDTGKGWRLSDARILPARVDQSYLMD